jgi:predicted protein tyrosine phosphatase
MAVSMNPLAIVFLAAGLGLLAEGLLLSPSPWSYLLLSAGLGFGLMGMAYLRRWTGVLGKRRDGRLIFSSYLLFWPYHLMNWMTCLVFRLIAQEHPFDPIATGVYLGARLLSSDKPAFEKAGIRSVLDLTSEFSEARFIRSKAGYACLPLLDRTAPSPSEFAAAVDFITRSLERGPAYVHCALGHGRSAVIAAAWMVKSGNASSATDALVKLKAARPGVSPSKAQFKALENFLKL